MTTASPAALAHKAVLMFCPPWLVALPVTAVRRILLPDQAHYTATHAEADGVRAPLLDLGRLLRLEAVCDQALVLVEHRGHTVALRTGRCLSIVDLPTLQPLANGSHRATSPLTHAFSAAALLSTHDAAPLGLWLDPARLITCVGTTA